MVSSCGCVVLQLCVLWLDQQHWRVPSLLFRAPAGRVFLLLGGLDSVHKSLHVDCLRASIWEDIRQLRPPVCGDLRRLRAHSGPGLSQPEHRILPNVSLAEHPVRNRGMLPLLFWHERRQHLL